MRRFNPFRAVIGAFVVLVLFGLILQEIKLRATPLKPSGRVPMEFRIVADPGHESEALEPVLKDEGLGKAPAGYRWIKVGDRSEIGPGANTIVRIDPTSDEPDVLVKLDAPNVSEKQVARLYPTPDERDRPAPGFAFGDEGTERFGALTREILPEPGGGPKHRLAIIVNDTAASAPVIDSEIRGGSIIEGGSRGFTDADVRRMIELLTHLLFFGADPAGESNSNIEARRWFQDAKFGLFVHWGVYSLLGKGEWVMEESKIPVGEYEKLPPQFNPTGFDAEEWVKTAKAAGMKYITITSKHHDGFCMFDSKLTRYDIVDATPYAKDPMKALADACHKQGLKLFLYYSLLDWHHPDYFPRGRTGHATGREEVGDWSKYVAYYQGQVRELCTNYGEIGGLWFDGWWDRPDADWDLAGTYKIIHDLQPGALIGNNHHVKPFPGEDFQIFERDLPGENEAGFNKAAVSESLPLETCQTLNRSWGYNARDKDYKSAEQVIHLLVGAAGRGANLLLNVGPKPEGTIGPEATERLLAVGPWLVKYGDSIYGTRRGPIAPQSWGVPTRREKPETIYLHVLKPGVPVALPKALLGHDARPFGSTDLLKKTQEKDGFTIEIPEKIRTPIDTVVVLTPEVLER